MADGGWK